MYNTIEFQKIIDIIDESIMYLYFLKKEEQFPEALKSDLVNILNFFSKAKNSNFEEVLHDNMFSIDMNDLNIINEKLQVVNLENIDISLLTKKIKDLGIKKLSHDEINSLESDLIDLSAPLWQTSTL